jgi:hypothetical protein
MADIKTNQKSLVNSAEMERVKLVKLLSELQDEIQIRSVQRRYNPFPYGQMEQGIAKVLDVFEQKMLFNRWAEQRLKRGNR